MKTAPLPEGEVARLRALHEYKVLDTEPDPDLDELAALAANICQVPVALVSLIDEKRQWFKARVGFDRSETPRDVSFCAHAITRPDELLVVHDARRDERFAGNPLVTDGGIRFYAGVPLVTPDGYALGSLCVLDRRPRRLTAEQIQALRVLAGFAMARLEQLRPDSQKQLAFAGSEFETQPAHEHVVVAHETVEDSRLALLDRVEDQQRAAEALGASARQLRLLVENLPVAIAYYDRRRICRFANARYAALFGRSVDSILDHCLGDVTGADLTERFGPRIGAVLDGAPACTFQRSHALPDGGRLELEIALVPDCDLHGSVRGCYAFLTDITERVRAQAELARAKERLQLSLQGSNLALWDVDATTRSVYLDENWARMLGAPPRETHTTLAELVALTHPDEQRRLLAHCRAVFKGTTAEYNIEHRVRAANGSYIWIHSRGRVVERNDAGEALRATGTNADITERKLAEERIEYLATRDALTDLPNRTLFNDRLERAIAHAARSSGTLALLFIDLDNFKTVNDSLGHPSGDVLLREVARRIVASVRQDDTVARPGGDEFLVLLPDIDGAAAALVVADKIRHSLSVPFDHDGAQLNTSASIGIAVYPDDGGDAATLVKNADAAMYHAKAMGRSNAQFFTERLTDQARERRELLNHLRSALANDELRLAYQPQFAVNGGRLVGVEALLRWHSRALGDVPPSRFIPVAEEAGLIDSIFDWLIEQACRQCRAWRALANTLAIAVNVSAVQFRRSGLPLAVERALTTCELDPSALELEITEGVLVAHGDETQRTLAALERIGVHLAIDDFGTGYSSLAYLKRFTVHKLKIDRSFVNDVPDDASNAAIVRAITAMARSFGLHVTAEGVETQAQLQFLQDAGCHSAQGYLLGRPVEPARFEQWLR